MELESGTLRWRSGVETVDTTAENQDSGDWQLGKVAARLAERQGTKEEQIHSKFEGKPGKIKDQELNNSQILNLKTLQNVKDSKSKKNPTEFEASLT